MPVRINIENLVGRKKKNSDFDKQKAEWERMRDPRLKPRPPEPGKKKPPKKPPQEGSIWGGHTRAERPTGRPRPAPKKPKNSSSIISSEALKRRLKRSQA